VAGSPPPKSVVVHETLANLSKLPLPLIEMIETYCKTGQNPMPEWPASDGVKTDGNGRFENG
jgi:hypothetical protein